MVAFLSIAFLIVTVGPGQNNVGGGAVSGGAAATGAAPASNNFILSSFNGTYPADAFKLFLSVDGLTWTNTTSSYSTALRDPSIVKIAGVWWLAHTSIPDTSSFQVTSSTDLQTWTAPQTIGVSPLTPFHVWAPEWFIDSDASVHIIVAVTQNSANPVTGPFFLYEIHPTNGAMTTWSTPAAITITGETNNAIDPYFVKIGSTYYCWYASWIANTSEFIQYGSSSSLTGPFTLVKTGNWAGWGGTGNGMEGPCLRQLSDRWRMYFDYVNPLFSTDAGQINYSDSFDSWATWTYPQAITTPQKAKHGTVTAYP